MLQRYRANAERADGIIATRSLHAAPAWWPDFFGFWRLHSLREIVLHVVTETATHAGHPEALARMVARVPHERTDVLGYLLRPMYVRRDLGNRFQDQIEISN